VLRNIDVPAVLLLLISTDLLIRQCYVRYWTGKPKEVHAHLSNYSLSRLLLPQQPSHSFSVKSAFRSYLITIARAAISPLCRYAKSIQKIRCDFFKKKTVVIREEMNA
jgi:hypothetical protein